MCATPQVEVHPATAEIEAGAASRRHLFGRLAVVEMRVAAAVDRVRAVDPDPDDRFRGLYVSAQHVDALLARGSGVRGLMSLAASAPSEDAAALLHEVEAEADVADAAGSLLRLRALRSAFGLDEYDLDLLLIALAPDLDPRFERLYGYLNDDVTHRRPSAGLALELMGSGEQVTERRARLAPNSPLVRGRLVVVEEPERPFLTRPLRVPDRVVGHLLGDDSADAAIADLVWDPAPAFLGQHDVLARALVGGCRLAYVRDRPGSAGVAMSAAAVVRAGLPVLAIDLTRLVPGDSMEDVAAAAGREAGLRGAALIAAPVEALADRGAAGVRPFGELACPTIIVGARGWDPAWAGGAPLLLDAPTPGTEERVAIWLDTLLAASGSDEQPLLAEAAAAALLFRLTPDQIARAARAAAIAARAAGRPLTESDVLTGARAQNAAGLERLARRIVPTAQWTDLVLPPGVLGQLHELTARARHRIRVLDDWGMAERASRGRGITALFAGDSGTGKTMSAEIVAGDLGLELYVIDLSTVVDKYIGETEKNLDRVFSEADRVNGVLLFDEADAIFGKRSEVRDARDRYANVEIAYLLQRMELFDGLAILTTNLRANLDEAFLRRLDAIVDFPMPEEDDRQQLWQKHLRPRLPVAPDLDLPFLSRAFKLSGGNIRNICLAGAFMAAEAGGEIGMDELIRATEREYQKLGRLPHEAEFGRYYALVSEAPRGDGVRGGQETHERAAQPGGAGGRAS